MIVALAFAQAASASSAAPDGKKPMTVALAKERAALVVYFEKVGRQYTNLTRAVDIAAASLRGADFTQPAALSAASAAFAKASDASTGIAVGFSSISAPPKLRAVHRAFVAGVPEVVFALGLPVTPFQALSDAITQQNIPNTTAAMAQVSSALTQFNARVTTWREKRLTWKIAVSAYARTIGVTVPSWIVTIKA